MIANSRSFKILALAILSSGLAGCSPGLTVAETEPHVEKIPNSPAPQEKQDILQEGNLRFATNLYQHVLENNQGEDVIFSPFSISTAMSMVWLGAAENTSLEIARTMGYLMPSDMQHAAWRNVLDSIGDIGGESTELNIANRLWGQQGFDFLDTYLEQSDAYYGASLEELNFKGDPEKSRVTINEWITDQTAGRIENLIPEGALDTLTRLVLTNAIHLKAEWARPFEDSSTHEGEFQRIGDESKTVSYMNQTANFSHGEWGEWQVLEMPYKDNRLAMVVLLPSEVGGLEALEQDLDIGEAMDFVRNGMGGKRVAVKLPKFRSELNLPLTKTLQEMGMETPFTDNADFSGMNGKKDLKLTDVFHRAFIEVNEEGTEAAAATAAVMGLKSLSTNQPSAIPFEATHPFVYLIHDRETNSVLFLGRVMNPSAPEE